MCCLPSRAGESRIGVVLAGGRSSRMGVDKLELSREGETLLQGCVTAALDVCERVLIVSPDRPGFRDDRVDFLLEDPPHGGPAAGLAAAVATLEGSPDDTEVLVLAGDLVDPAAVVGALTDAAFGGDGVVLEDEEGWPQYLAARYRLLSLRRVLEAWGHARGLSVRRVLKPLNLERKNVSNSVTMDLDTPDLARRYGFMAP
ncbi:molybdenum cofactor guanylyltransferase [Arachnia propionica]|uniref:Molybdopterin-guanine dinucleotide biosynthesis protein n=1 Tax=Arachnia propionica TaxID=1750 RepID=A0A3P1WZ40_9ACTN|nr:nucleotidyltransferase family protein [Arachnia propionica]RRD51356.1 molybdopterin-guanine dinucleotide biosynthesis protein [Arachnia propionica]